MWDTVMEHPVFVTACNYFKALHCHCFNLTLSHCQKVHNNKILLLVTNGCAGTK